MSVLNPGTGNTRGNQNAISLREKLKEGMKKAEDSQTKAKKFGTDETACDTAGGLNGFRRRKRATA